MPRSRLLFWLGQPTNYVALIGLGLIGAMAFGLRQPFYVNILVLTLFYAAASSAWNLIGGFAGQLSLGHTAFFGIGAYTSTLLFLNTQLSPWLGMLVGGCLAAAFALLISYPCFRLRGPFFALATIALAEVLRILSLYFRSLTKGGVGLVVPFKPSFWNFVFADKTTYAEVGYVFLILMVLVAFLIKRSRIGYYLACLRDDHDAAEATGVNTARCKLFVMLISAFFTAVSGTFYSQYLAFIDPDIVFSMNFSIQLALLPIIGGMGTIAGPIIGSFLLVPVDALLRGWLGGFFAGISFLSYGILLIVVVINLPEGVLPWLRRKAGGLMAALPRISSTDELSEAHATLSPVLRTRADRQPGPLFEVENLSKAFGGLKAVDRVSFAIQAGEILSLIGPNGAGKTTVFNLISGFLKPDEGVIRFLGRDITALRPPSGIARQGIGRTFQIVKPFSNLSLLENVMIGALAACPRPAEARRRAFHTLGLVGLRRGHDAPVGSLPIGDRKRLELARAIATGARLLLLDEVMGGLNPAEVGAMISLLKQIAQSGVTLLVIEHVMRAVMSLSDRVIVLEHGTIIAEGTPGEIGRNPRVIEAYLGEEYLHAAGF
jgi:branched-chain amino acid transport system permease protein